MTKQIDFKQILQDEASFQLVRTNPKLTGNVQITVDGNDNMWLNSIDANEELSKSIYKRVAIDPEVGLPANMYNFFNDGKTPSEIVFALTEDFDSTKTSTNYKDQFDFSKYFSGVRYLSTRRYQEKLSYFAPIFLKEEVPEHFVIFKVNDPLNNPIDQMKESYPFDREDYIKDLFKKSTIIKTFDLRETTKVGKYLRDHINNTNFPKNPLNVSYDEDTLTDFNGILYNAGVFGSRGENLYEFYQTSNPLKYFEEFITLGFERNGVIFPNILNLEFIFDDDTSELYDFNRYIGMYVNTIELSKCDIDLNRAYEERSNWENTPRIRREFFEWEEVDVNQDNVNGVIIPINNLDVYLSDFENIFNNKNNMFFNYLTDRKDNIHLPKLDNPYDIDYDINSLELKSGKIRMSDTHLEMGDFFGPGASYIQDKGTNTSVRGLSYSYLKIGSIQHLDGIKLYHPNGSRSDINGRYELIEGVSSYSELPNPGDSYIFNDTDNVTGYNVYYFNIDGTELERTNALAGCINGIANASFKAFVYNDYIFIKSNVAGDYDAIYSLEFISASSTFDNIIINDLTGSDLIGTLINFEGGYRGNNRVIIDSSHFNKVNTKLNDILIKTTKGWSKIKKISKYIDSITEKNAINKTDRLSAINDFFNLSAVVIEFDEPVYINQGDFNMVLKHRPSFGLLSFFPIKDFDFDFYSSEYLNFPKIDLFEHYYIPPNVTRLEALTKYYMYGTGKININGTLYQSPGDFTLTTGPSDYIITSGDVVVSSAEDISALSLNTNLWEPVNDQNEELKGFTGFFLLKDPSLVVPEPDIENFVFSLRDKYLNGIASSEYDFYKENSTTDFALRSKIIPYITKWAIPDGLDTRSNPYRLNTELTFGFNNFAPDHEDRSQNPSNFTHEWYYIESKFSYADDADSIVLNNSYFDTPFDLNKALTEAGYFIDYFTYTPTFNGEELGRTQTRYTPITKNNIGVYESFFKGFKISFKDYIDATNINEAGKPEFNSNSNKYEGYRFSTLLKTVKEDINDDTTPPIRYRFIEHEEFKFVILLIELSIGSQDKIEDYWGSVNSSQYNNITNLTTSGDSLNFLDVTPSTTVQAYDSVNGDYRIRFDNINGLDISNITHTLLYSLKHKKFNNIEDNFSNLKLSTKLSIDATGAFNSNDNIKSIGNLNFPNYPSNLSDEVIVPSEKTFVIGYDKLSNIDKIIDSVNGFVPENINKIQSAGLDFITYLNVSGPLQYGLIDASTNLLTQYIPSPFSNTYTHNNIIFKILSGGELYFEKLFEKLSFGDFKENVNEVNVFIEYETYSYDGSTLISKDSKWYAEIPDTSYVTKVDAILANIDRNKPSNLAFKNVIGYTYERATLDNPYDINRYSGGFSPLFKDLFTFNSKFKFTKNDIRELDSSNTSFNINTGDFLNIPNFSHIKIANTKILDLESDEEFEPKYETANEIAINRGSYDLLTSNWDYGFHRKYLDKTKSIPVSGTLRIEEDDSFIAKIINLRETIELEQYTINKVKDVELQNLEVNEIVYQENDLTISGKINVNNALISYLITDGIGEKFNEFLIAKPEFIGNFETIKDYVIDYINLNIIKLYEIIEIEFYSKEDRTLLEDSDNSNINAIEFRMLNDKERFDQGYKLDRNLLINKLDRFTLGFEFAKALNSGKLISPKIKIKFI
jgi:hypothetical protein